MGVRWLTTYVKDVQRVISSQKQFDCDAGPDTEAAEADRPTFVVDGWAFIYAVWLRCFVEAIRTLDYELYKRAVKQIVEAWLSAGIAVIVVFDGPFLPSKLPTELTRRGYTAGCNLGFMHSSPQSRMSRRLQQSSNIVPLMLYHATIDVVRSLKPRGVQLILAPTEADSLVAEIASQKRQGYALSQDSDFFILCARGNGCAGYVPLDSIQYVVDLPEQHPDFRGTDDSGLLSDGFEQVGKKKRTGKRGFVSLSTAYPTDVPPQHVDTVPPMTAAEGRLRAVRIQAYRSHDLAAHLQLPPTLLPLFAALVGNDYTTSTQSSLLLRHLDHSQRIPSVAAVLCNEWLRIQNEIKAGSSARRGTTRLAMTNVQDFDDGRSDVGSSATATPTRSTPGPTRSAPTVVPSDPVRSMVEAVVDKFLAQADAGHAHPRYVATGERELIVDSVIDSAATYSLLTHSDAPHLASPSALFFGQAMTLLASRRDETIAFPEALARYRDSYHAGHFRSSMIEAMSQRVFLTQNHPEDPEAPSIHTNTGRELRQWLFSILFEVWGVSWARKEWEEPARSQEGKEDADDLMLSRRSTIFPFNRGYEEGEKPDDVISVDTESSESEADAGGEAGPDELPSRPGSVLEEREQDKPAPGVVEYVRAGTLYNAHLVRIRPLTEMLRFGADVDVSGEAARDHNKTVNAKRTALPSTLADLLARHEANQPSPADTASASRDVPESDPAPPAVALQPLAVRLDLFLHAHHADTAAIKALPRRHWLPASVLRCMIIGEAKRLGPHRKRFNWSRAEVGVAVRTMLAGEQLDDEGRQEMLGQAMNVLPSTRAIHLSSGLQLILETSNLLAQALLLPVDEPQWTYPHSCFFGPLFHVGMARIHGTDTNSDEQAKKQQQQQQQNDVPETLALEQSIIEGLEAELGIDALDLKRERKAKKREVRSARLEEEQGLRSKGANKLPTSSSASARNAFAALLDAD